MAAWKRTLDRLLSGTSDRSFRFTDLVNLLKRYNFQERIRGDHHIFTREGLEEILNLRPRNGMAKPYQVKQVRSIFTNHGLAVSEDEATDSESEQESHDA
jgi:hypothetical protein